MQSRSTAKWSAPAAAKYISRAQLPFDERLMDGVTLVGAGESEINNVDGQLQRFPSLGFPARLAAVAVVAQIVFHPGAQKIVGAIEHRGAAFPPASAADVQPFQIF